MCKLATHGYWTSVWQLKLLENEFSDQTQARGYGSSPGCRRWLALLLLRGLFRGHVSHYLQAVAQHLVWCDDGGIVLKHTKKIEMENEKIVVANLKCSGCATTIKKELLKIKGVRDVKVDIDNDAVTLVSENANRNSIIERLSALGYPEATEKNGLLLQLKSYASCMIGRVNNKLG